MVIYGFIHNFKDYLQNTINKINYTKFHRIISNTKAIQNLVKKRHLA